MHDGPQRHEGLKSQPCSGHETKVKGAVFDKQAQGKSPSISHVQLCRHSSVATSGILSYGQLPGLLLVRRGFRQAWCPERLVPGQSNLQPAAAKLHIREQGAADPSIPRRTIKEETYVAL